ncbi:MAG: alpha-ketoglutarate-dependent dioxygenase AlkB [Schleiferiaceae bacterium]|nr:alpha-ketoglutarate-dependent dioxygenase AlkB [Schleiferiaceae bacterium]
MIEQQFLLEGWQKQGRNDSLCLLLEHGSLELYLNFLPDDAAENYISKITSNREELSWSMLQKVGLRTKKLTFTTVDWIQERVRVFGKWHNAPRLTAWEGDVGICYKYSGVIHTAGGWHEETNKIRERISKLTKLPFNSVLYNWYRDGIDTMGWHSDDEKELGENPQIASYSFGASRTIKFRLRKNNKIGFSFQLPSNSLLIMKGSIQHHWQHAIPKRLTERHPRINLTFRNIIQASY